MTAAVNAFLQGIKVQNRVIMALMLREVHTIYGSSKLGYIWELIQSAFGIAVFWWIRSFVGSMDPHGLSLPVFLILGFGTFTVISRSISKLMSAVSGNRTLLTFPQVTELDVMIARVIVLFVTQVVVSVIMLIAAIAFDYEVQITNFGLFTCCLLLAPLLGLGAGMVLSSLAVFLPVLEHIVPMMLRILFFTSGVFFSINRFGSDVVAVLSYNPILNLIELMRSSFGTGYDTTNMSLSYVAVFTLVLLSVGLLLERYVRPRRPR